MVVMAIYHGPVKLWAMVCASLYNAVCWSDSISCACYVIDRIVSYLTSPLTISTVGILFLLNTVVNKANYPHSV